MENDQREKALESGASRHGSMPGVAGGAGSSKQVFKRTGRLGAAENDLRSGYQRMTESPLAHGIRRTGRKGKRLLRRGLDRAKGYYRRATGR